MTGTEAAGPPAARSAADVAALPLGERAAALRTAHERLLERLTASAG